MSSFGTQNADGALCSDSPEWLSCVFSAEVGGGHGKSTGLLGQQLYSGLIAPQQRRVDMEKARVVRAGTLQPLSIYDVTECVGQSKSTGVDARYQTRSRITASPRNRLASMKVIVASGACGKLPLPKLDGVSARLRRPCFRPETDNLTVFCSSVMPVIVWDHATGFGMARLYGQTT